ncbi:hypothetical protein A2U01_0000175 [Trifolium medium]|uniref:Uncharacterized protein n=1 Tax=Trifolium medium TaxID=97028 RepID=A0A392LWW6_9FABA|nr:hypothetical protein [Trifolium medium]
MNANDSEYLALLSRRAYIVPPALGQRGRPLFASILVGAVPLFAGEHVFNVLLTHDVEWGTSLADVSGKSPRIGLCPKCRAEGIGPALGPVQNRSPPSRCS